MRTTSLETLKKNVKQILEETAFLAILKNAHDIEVAELSTPKQTETTQRWKISLRVKDRTQADVVQFIEDQPVRAT